MGKDTEFERIVGWIDRLNSSMEAARADQAATGNLLSGIEYELQQVHRHLATVELEAEAAAASAAAPAAAPARGASAGDAFNNKLRHPLNAYYRELWAVVASGR